MSKNLVAQTTPITESNIFYRYSASLALLQQVSKMIDKPSKSVVMNYLTAAWKECSGNLESRKMFWSVVFSFGDVVNREHNIFRKKGIKNVDQGGNSLRKVFMYCLEWMNINTPEQLYSFFPVLGEYYNLGAMTMFNIIWTDRFKGNVLEHYQIDIDKDRLTSYIAGILSDSKTSESDLKLWAKWLWRVPTGQVRTHKRVITDKGLKSMQRKYNNTSLKVGNIALVSSPKQSKTLQKDREILECIKLLSEKMGWLVKSYKTNILYSGYKSFRSKYLGDTEAHLFSSQKIKEFSMNEFIDWIDVQPSSARFRVQKRLFESVDGKLVSRKKWFNNQGTDMATFYDKWLADKEVAQNNLRSLTTEEKETLAKEDPKVLREIEKKAKVNTGAETILDNIAKLLSGGDKATTNVVCQSILDKVKIQVPVLVIADTSSSMSHNTVTHKGITFKARDMAAIATTIFMYKNPSETAKDLLITFSSTSRVLHDGAKGVFTGGSNRFLQGTNIDVVKLIDRTEDFLSNYARIGKYVNANGATHFSAVCDLLDSWVKEDENLLAHRREMVNQYPVILVVSDGDLNDDYTAKASMEKFQSKMREWFGWDGVIVVWDVQTAQVAQSQSKFEGIPNVMYYGGCNPGILNQIFTSIDDLDVIDVYTPLLSMYRSNRYEPVRKLVK